ncbi:MAG: helix-turn-helix transcriptional regulator [Lamprobacter sp.]|uniref:helix-turn-helix domain-containing protein n=1 Tax=Lamprobacter sp. TaxID=3100796 RepID=UPI002B25781D|nr:helix-turn-helix transcriptional regulator [Lamprobacter sp.]MEA3643040.1 helix-turn-helix transcriptional regulator [Lamprobacter sp.]
MTQEELATALQVSKAVIARNENSEMVMRADTLVRLIYLMRARQIEIDLFSTPDTVKISATGPWLDAAAMRAARAALALNQQEFADRIGLTKPVVTRGERPKGNMRAETMLTLFEAMAEEGIELDWSLKSQTLNIIVNRKAVAAIEAMTKAKATAKGTAKGKAKGKAKGTVTASGKQTGETLSNPAIEDQGDKKDQYVTD